MKENHILPFLWMRGEEEQILRTEIGKIYDAGIRSVCLEARPHPDYAGEKWWHDVDIVIDEAKKRDMQIWILDDAHFPTGMANGAMPKHPDKARRFLFTNFVDVTGPLPAAQVDAELLSTKQFTWMDLGKPRIEPLIDETKILSVTAARVCNGDVLSGEILDLTGFVKDGYLTWDVPAGTWRVFVSFSTTAFGHQTEYINYIEEDSVRVLIDEVYEKHYEKYKDLFGTVIAGFFSDEPGFYNRDSYDEFSYLGLRNPLPWGREMNTLLRELYGENVYRDLPYLFSDQEDGAHRTIRYAYMDAVSRLYSKNFCCQLGDWCRAHNVRYIGHVVEDYFGYMRLGAGTGHYFRAMAGQDMAGIDNIGYQIMPCNDDANRHTGGPAPIKPAFYHYAIGKLGASAAAIDPAKKGRLLCENFGAYGWRLGVRDMKWLVDYLVCQGVNYFVPHAFSMAEYPDSDCPPHFYARGSNPQYPYFCDLMKYTDRLCRLFSDGMGVPQAAVLFEAEAEWAGKTMFGFEIGKELLTHQIDFLFLPNDVFAEGAACGCTAEGKELVINDRRMKVLIVPECEYIPAAAAGFIAGHPEVPVLYVNAFPRGIAGAVSDEAALLAAATAGRECVPLSGLGRLLRERGCTDDLCADRADRNLLQYHYRKDSRDYYFLMNCSSSEDAALTFRLPRASSFGLYDAMADVTTVLTPSEGKALLRIRPYQSLILCTEPASASPAEPEGRLVRTIPLEKFELTLKRIGQQEPETIRDFCPAPVSSFDRDFSGELIYRTSINVDALPKRALFSARYVFECMTVCVNGKALPSVITPPYVSDIASALKEGVNELEIHVATTALRDANTRPGLFGKERTVLEPTGMFGEIKVELFE